MKKVDKILVAIAFSEYARGIFDYAAGLAIKLDATLVAVSIINSRDVEAVATITAMGYEVDEAHFLEKIETERRQILKTFVADSDIPPERVKIIFKVGNPIDELLKTIILEEVDMVVMGTKGRTDLEHLLVGSVAEKLFRYSPVPVVSFRDQKQAAYLKKRIHLDE